MFSYTVAVGDSDTDGISIAADKINLKGGAIKDLSGNPADLSHSAVTTQSGHKVDGIKPTITSAYLIGSTFNEDGVLTIYEYLPAGMRFSEHVYVGGYLGPRMKLNFEGTTKSADFGGAYPECIRAVCVYGPGGRYGISVDFEYMIAKGDLDLDGVAIDANSLVLNGGSIRDGAGNDAVLTHSAVAEDPDHIVDGVPATIKSVAITSNPGSDNTYGVGDRIEVTVTFSESVRVPKWSGSNGIQMPRLELNIGGVAKIAKTPETATITGTSIVFRYTVQDGDDDANGISVGANKLSLNGGSIRDANGSGSPGGNSADLTHSAVADDSGHKVATSGPPKSTDATLSALTLSRINIGTFASGTTSYSDQVPNSVSQTTVTPTVNHSGASYVIRLGGFADSDGAIPLAVGSNVITVEVTAEDDSTTKTYTVIVTRASNNRPATDAPTISGTAQVGQALTAETSGIADEDGLTNVSYSYQWLTSRDTKIDGATNSTYTLQASDNGKVIKVRVSFADDAGNEEALTSAATAAVAPALTVSGITSTDYAENGTTAVATYAVAGAGTSTITWSLSGDDSGDFSISSAGVLSFRSSPDYESPADADTNNVYQVTIQASNGTSTGTLDVTVTVTDANEGPTII